MELIKLKDKIKYLKRALKTPYHFFFITQNKQIMIILEDKQGKRYSFTGNTMFTSVEVAEEYVKNEIEAGSIIDPNKKIESKKKEDENR